MIYYKNMASTANIIFIFAALILLLSCAHKKIENTGSFSSQPISSRNASLIGTAKEVAIPLPLGFKCIEKQTTDDTGQTVTRYEGTLSFEKVMQFYRRELEQAGGAVTDFTSKNEGVLYYIKSHEEYAFTVNRRGAKTLVTSFHRPKATDHEQKQVNEKVDTINKALSKLVHP